MLDACGIPEEARTVWRDALLRVRRAPKVPPTCPYPGLESFQPEDAERFRGRADLVAAVLAGIGPRPLVVVGASGSGKSSLLRAGVVPALRQDGTAVVFTPGRDPLGALDRHATAAGVLVVDQFEELFGPDVPEADRPAFASAFSPDGRLLAASSADTRTYLWDVAADPPRLLTTLDGSDGFAYSPAFSPDGAALAAASTDGTVWVRDVSDVRAPVVAATLTDPADAVFSVAWSPDGRRLTAGSADRTVRLWTVDPAEATAAVCAGTGPVIGPQEWERHVPDLPYEPPC